MKRALIVTVGTGTRADVYIVRPLVKTIRDSRPDFTVLVATDQSRLYAEKIIEELKLEEGKSYRLVTLTKADDYQKIFGDVNNIFRDLFARGYSCDDIQLDFTSGTKAMTAGAVLSAIFNQCGSLKYITGERKNGVVQDDTERFLSINPKQIFNLHDVRLADELIFNLRFATAVDLLRKINLSLLSKEERDWAESLTLIAKGYREWDVFNHGDALRQLNKINWELADLSRFNPTAESRTLLQRLAEEKKSPSEDLLLDLYNNAVRRGIEGKYDDAVARLYRATECFAQFILQSVYQIDSSDVDISRVPEAMRNRLQKNKGGRDDKIRVGLYLDYELLAAFGHPAGRCFLENKALQGRLAERNTSILAHGVKPVSYSLHQKLRTGVVELFNLQIPDFETRAQAVQFPWLKSVTDGTAF